MRLSISIKDELVERMDNYADENFMSRSGFISLACTQYLNSQELVGLMRDMSKTLNRIADAGKIDHETAEELERIEDIVSMLSGNSF